MTFVLWGLARGSRLMPPLCTSSTVKSSLFVWFFESQIKLLENSYIDDSMVCIVRKKVDNKFTNSPYVSFLCDDITTDILVEKKLGVYLKSEL